MEVRGVVQCVVLFVTITLSQQQDLCRNRYTIQPPTYRTCDVRVTSQITIGCEITTRQGDEPVSDIQWVLDPYSRDIPTSVLTSANRFTITTNTSSYVSTSTLTIRPVVQADIGTVYCQGVFQNGSITNPSQEMSFSSFDSSGECPPNLMDRLSDRCALSAGRRSSPPPNLCLYQYYTQPHLDCNPYNDHDYSGISTECDVSFGPTQERVGVQWFFIPENSDTIIRIKEILGKYLILTTNFTYRIHSRLSVSDLHDSDRGTYYCQIQFEDGRLGQPSQNLTLLERSAYEGQDLCLSGGQTVSRQRCSLSSSMMPSPAGPTDIVKDELSKSIIVWASVIGALGFLVLVMVMLITACYFVKIRKNSMEYSFHGAYTDAKDTKTTSVNV